MNTLTSRLSGKLADTLRQKLLTEEFSAGQLLPGERALSQQYKVSGKTVRRALKILEAEALIAPESRRGHRVLGRVNSPENGYPLALVIAKPASHGAEWFYRRIMSEMQDAAGQRARSMLCIQSNGRAGGDIAAHLKAARASGVIVESADRELIGTIANLGIPIVLADAWAEGVALDTVVQDGFAGAILAAEYLAEQGCKRLAFIGPELKATTPQIAERFGGAVTGAVRCGLSLDAARCVSAPMGDHAAAVNCARQLLSGKVRPDGIIAPWQSYGLAVHTAARELGLKPGVDFQWVGWSTEEDFETEFAQKLQLDWIPPTVIWSVAELAEMCILRLMQRQADPRLPASFTRIPMKLRLVNRGK